jgi:hypothetical protein
MNLKTLAYWASVATLGVVLGVSLQFVKAWTEPASAPPNGNIGAPINTGANTQRKTNGTLQVDNSIVAGNLTAAQKPAALAGKPVTGNVYVNDMYVNNANKWVSQMGSPFSTCTTVTKSATYGPISVTCAAGYTMTGGGCSACVGNNCDTLKVSIPTANGWTCEKQGIDSGGITAYARCCK